MVSVMPRVYHDLAGRLGIEMDEAEKVAAAVRAAENRKRLWAFFRENFTVISGVAVICGITFAIIFLFSYLSAFSWRLIELVEYVDVITFGIIAVGVASGSLLAVSNIAELWFRFQAIETKEQKRAFVIIIVVLAAVLFGLTIWAKIKGKNGYIHVVYGTTLLFMVVAILIKFLRDVKAEGQWTAAGIANYAILAILLTWFGGQWLAYTVQERSDFDQDVVTKTGEFKSAKIVIVMSRFTVLLQDRTLHVVPTGDITEFKTIKPINILVNATPPQPFAPAQK